MTEQKKPNEFARFDSTMRQLMKVSHAELKAKLDAEKAQKKMRKSITKKSQ